MKRLPVLEEIALLKEGIEQCEIYLSDAPESEEGVVFAREQILASRQRIASLEDQATTRPSEDMT